MAGPGGREVGRVSIRVLPDTSQFGARLRAALEKIERRMQVRIPVELDTSGLTREAATAAAAARKEMQAQLSRIETNLKVDADTARASAQIARVTRDRVVNVTVRVTRRSISALTGIISQLSGAEYLRAVIRHINMDTLQLVQIAVTLGAAISQATGALAAMIPATVGLASVIGGTLYLAFSKINKQLPAFKRFQSELGNFEAAYTRLRNTVQTNIFGALAREVGPLGRTYMPLLQRGLDGVSKAIGNVIRQAAGGLLNPKVVANTKTLIDNTRDAINAFAPAIRNIIVAFSDLSAVGSSFFPQMASNATKATQRFKEFIAEARKTGELKEFIEQGLSALRSLWNTVKNVAGAFAGLWRAMEKGGSGGIKAIEQATAALKTFINSAPAQNSLTKLFSGLNSGLAQLNDGLKNAEPAILGIIGALGTALNQVGNILGSALSAIGPAVEPLIPILNSLINIVGNTLARAFEILGPPLQQVTNALSNALAPIMPIIAQGLNQILTALTPVVEQLGQGLADAINMIAPHLPMLVRALLGMSLAFAQLLASLAPVIPPLLQLIAIIGIAAIQAIATFADAIRIVINVINVLVRWIGQAVSWVTNFVTSLVNGGNTAAASMTGVGNIIRNVLNSIKNAFSSAANWIGTQISKIVTFFTNLWNRGVAIFNNLRSAVVNRIRNMINTARNNISNGVRTIISFFSNLLSRASSIFSNLRSNVVSRVRSMASQAVSSARQGFQRMVNAVRNKARDVINVAKRLPGQIKSGLGNLGRLLYQAGVDVVTGLANGIRNAAGKAISAAKNIANQVSSTIKGALRIGSPSKLMRDYGQWTSEGLALGIEDRLRRVGEASARMANAAVPTFATAGGPAVAGNGGSGVTINQTVNPSAGMNEKRLANETMRRMAFAMRR